MARESKEPTVSVSISQNAADELYALAATPRIVAIYLSNEVREELLALKPPEPEAKAPPPKARASANVFQ